jgi:CRISPR-associated protein Csb2
VFQLLTPDADGYRPFDPVRRTHVVAGMVRHAARRAAEAAGKPGDWIASFVLGHGDGINSQARADARFAYLPLPTINPRKVESIRRVLVAEPSGGSGADARWAMRVLSGAELIHEGTPVGLLSVTSQTERVVQRYVPTSGAATWCSVTPVVLPGHDEARPLVVQRRQQRARTAEARREVAARAEERTEKLLRKAIGQAGFPPELANDCTLEWRQAGYFPGVDLASRYAVPPYLDRLPRYHVRIVWRNAAGQPIRIPGPVAIGAGRYCGLGLFAASE